MTMHAAAAKGVYACMPQLVQGGLGPYADACRISGCLPDPRLADAGYLRILREQTHLRLHSLWVHPCPPVKPLV